MRPSTRGICLVIYHDLPLSFSLSLMQPPPPRKCLTVMDHILHWVFRKHGLSTVWFWFKCNHSPTPLTGRLQHHWLSHMKKMWIKTQTLITVSKKNNKKPPEPRLLKFAYLISTFLPMWKYFFTVQDAFHHRVVLYLPVSMWNGIWRVKTDSFRQVQSILKLPRKMDIFKEKNRIIPVLDVVHDIMWRNNIISETTWKIKHFSMEGKKWAQQEHSGVPPPQNHSSKSESNAPCSIFTCPDICFELNCSLFCLTCNSVPMLKFLHRHTTYVLSQ